MLDEPQFLSDFYLSAFLDTLLSKGWDIFVVRGPIPKYNPLKFSGGNAPRLQFRLIWSVLSKPKLEKSEEKATG